MPIGEDIPMLIPVSIILTVIILFLFGTFTSIAEKNELVRMSQVSQDTMDYITNIKFSGELGTLDKQKLGSSGIRKYLDALNITVNYNMKINITDTTKGVWWYWRNTDDNPEKSIVTSVPFVIINGNNTDLGTVTVIVGK